MNLYSFVRKIHTVQRLPLTRLELAVIFGLLLSLLMAQTALFGQTCRDMQETIIRLHVFANSDSAPDQSLKLEVRERILQTIGDLFHTALPIKTALQSAEAYLPAMESAARQVLEEHGLDMPVYAKLSTKYFSTREYEGLFFPAGNYYTVQIILGAGEGRNWWYVLYPPLKTSQDPPPLQQPSLKGTSPEALEVLASQEQAPFFRPKLAIVEAVESLKNKYMELIGTDS